VTNQENDPVDTSDDRLPHLMRRATETLEPRYPDLVERGMRRGVVLRRRRRVLGSVAAAATVAMTVAGVTALQGTVGSRAVQPPVAGFSTPTPTPTPKPQPRKPGPATPTGTLKTLKAELPSGVKPVGGEKLWGDDFIAAGLLVDDGRGKSWLEVSVQTVKYDPNCEDQPSTQHCRKRPDGSFLRSYQAKDDGGVLINSVIVEYPDRRGIYLGSTNALSADHGVTAVRAEPPLSIDQLVTMADSRSWSFPAANYGKNLNR